MFLGISEFDISDSDISKFDISGSDTLVDVQFIGGIGSTQPEFSKEILDSSRILDDVMLRLQGLVRVTDKTGEDRLIQIGDRKYDDRVIIWVRGKLLEVLNKNMYLSNLSAQDMYREAHAMAMGFWDETWINWGEQHQLTPGEMTELLHLYTNFLSQATRHPLGEGIRRFLKDTTQETTSRVQQTLTESSDKKGLIGGLFGR